VLRKPDPQNHQEPEGERAPRRRDGRYVDRVLRKRLVLEEAPDLDGGLDVVVLLAEDLLDVPAMILSTKLNQKF